MSIAAVRSRHPRLVRGLVEIVLILGLWVGYSLSRLFADTAVVPALGRARELLRNEAGLRLNWELSLNQVFVRHDWLGLVSSFWYASLHYAVTVAVLLWLYRLGSEIYLPARRALVIATMIGLTAYLLVPTAPPRFIDGYTDILNLYAASGWWGVDASAPRGLGGLTNELAAFPSLHAGWALWVAVALQLHGRWKWLRVLGWAYAAGTAVVIVGTGNHWVLDVVGGWLVVLTGVVVAGMLPASWRGPSATPAPTLVSRAPRPSGDAVARE